MRFNFIFTLLASFALFSCNSKEEVVTWTSLSELDSISISVEHAAAHEHAEQKALLTQAKSLISQVSSSVPDNAKNKEEVAVLVKDLSALSAQIHNLDALGHDELDALSKAIHPIVAKLMETAGVPHVHAEKPGESHEGHDH